MSAPPDLIGVDRGATIRSQDVFFTKEMGAEAFNAMIRTAEAGIMAVAGVLVPIPATFAGPLPMVRIWESLSEDQGTYPGEKIIRDIGFGNAPPFTDVIFGNVNPRLSTPRESGLQFPLYESCLCEVFSINEAAAELPLSKQFVVSRVFAFDDPTYPGSFGVWDLENEIPVTPDNTNRQYRIIRDQVYAQYYGHTHNNKNSPGIPELNLPFNTTTHVQDTVSQVVVFDTAIDGNHGDYSNKKIPMGLATNAPPQARWWNVRVLWQWDDQSAVKIQISNTADGVSGGSGNYIPFKTVNDCFGCEEAEFNNLDGNLYFNSDGATGDSQFNNNRRVTVVVVGFS